MRLRARYYIISTMRKDKITIDNFRDFGALTTGDGRRFKEGKLFRSATLKAKTTADKHFLDGLGLDVIFDFRTPTEIEESPDYIPKGTRHEAISILDSVDTENTIVFTKKSKLHLLTATEEEMQGLIRVVSDTYVDMPFSDGYKRVFDAMDKGETIVFHCTAGKDRTGVCAMIIEFAFGRKIEDVKYEYMLSNEYRADTNRKLYKLMKFFHAPAHSVNACMYALTNHEENFDLAVNTILSRYGTIENYLAKTYDVTPDRIALWSKYYLE